MYLDDCVCVLPDLTWLPLRGVGRKSWYIIQFLQWAVTKCYVEGTLGCHIFYATFLMSHFNYTQYLCLVSIIHTIFVSSINETQFLCLVSIIHIIINTVLNIINVDTTTGKIYLTKIQPEIGRNQHIQNEIFLHGKEPL